MLTKEQFDIAVVLEKQYPNNMQLGAEFRSRFIDSEIARKFNNDMDLGKVIRTEILEKNSK